MTAAPGDSLGLSEGCLVEGALGTGVAGVQPRISRTESTSMQNSWPPTRKEITSGSGLATAVA